MEAVDRAACARQVLNCSGGSCVPREDTDSVVCEWLNKSECKVVRLHGGTYTEEKSFHGSDHLVSAGPTVRGALAGGPTREAGGGKNRTHPEGLSVPRRVWGSGQSIAKRRALGIR